MWRGPGFLVFLLYKNHKAVQGIHLPTKFQLCSLNIYGKNGSECLILVLMKKSNLY